MRLRIGLRVRGRYAIPAFEAFGREHDMTNKTETRIGLRDVIAGYVEPDLSKGYGGAILSMLRGGQAVDDFEARCMDIALILYIEHEFNAGSFGARVSASAHSDLYGSMVVGEAILRGTRHGCAN